MKVRVLIAVMMLTMVAGQGPAIEAAAWVTHSDVGLYDSRGGGGLGVSGNVLSDSGSVDLTFGFEYIQRRGAQPRYFAHPTDGLILDNAEVVLHYLQPVALVGVSFPVGKWVPRVYGGLSFALKVGETWNQPEGETNGEIGYEDTDVLVHLGTTIQEGRYFIDFRYSWGLTRQVVDNTTFRVEKLAEDVEAGLDAFEDGNKVHGFQAGLGYRF